MYYPSIITIVLFNKNTLYAYLKVLFKVIRYYFQIIRKKFLKSSCENSLKVEVLASRNRPHLVNWGRLVRRREFEASSEAGVWL